MKTSELLKLKEIVLAHKKEYTTKEQGKRLWYENYKKEILGRIDLIEKLDIRKKKFLDDIQEYLNGMKKKLEVELLPPEVSETTTSGTEASGSENGRAVGKVL